MATEVVKELELTYDNATTYLIAHTLELHESSLGNHMVMRLYMDGSTTGYAILNDAARALLFPSSTARPHQMNVRYTCSALMRNNNTSAAFSAGGVELHKASGLGPSATKVDETYTGAAIVEITQDTEMRYTLISNSTVNAVLISSAGLTLHFWQFSMQANIAAGSDGVQSASVSNAAPYEGDSVTFSAALKPGAVWHGWYSDAECTQLASTSQSYTTAAADLTLYAKATREVTGTGSYAKVGGQWAEAQDVYKKVNGEWVLQTDNSYKTEMQNGHYIVKETMT